VSAVSVWETEPSEAVADGVTVSPGGEVAGGEAPVL
jgi:hypothetical protein